MTELLSRPTSRAQSEPPSADRSAPLGAALVAAVVAASGLVTCVALSVSAWFAADSGSFADAVRVGVLGWLVLSGGGLHLTSAIAGGPAAITVLPIGFVAVNGWLTYRGSRWVAWTCRLTSARLAAASAAALGGTYAAIGALVWSVSRLPAAHGDLIRTLASTLVTGMVFGGFGFVHGSGRAILSWLPVEVVAITRGALCGVAVVICCSSLLFVSAMAAHFSTATTLAENLHAGIAGGLVVAFTSAAFVPNAIICAGAFAVGPGFHVGAGTLVSPRVLSVGPLPDVPLLAGLPVSVGSWWQVALVCLPLVAGIAAGVVTARTHRPGGLAEALILGGFAGVAAGVLFGVMCQLASGSAGPGRMSQLGPDVVATTVLASGGCLLGGALAAVSCFLLGRDRDVAQVEDAVL